MAFKKKGKGKGKGKTGKGKKSKSRNESEWDFEGGTSANATAEVKPVRKYWQTQEKDECRRRAMLKVDNRKRKSEFVNKMKKKIKFGDVLDEIVEAKPAIVQTVKAPVRENVKNPISAYNRLQNFLSAKTSVDADGSDDSSLDNESNAHDDEISSEASDDLKEEIIDDEPTMIEDVDCVEDNEETDAQYRMFIEWYQSVQAEESIESLTNKNQTISISPQFKLIENLNSNASIDLNQHDFKRLKDIPCLHRMWKSSTQALPALGSHLMKSLLTFADMFIEGRDHITDSTMLQSVLTHVCVTTLRSRTLIAKHNQKLKKKALEESAALEEDKESKSHRKKKKLLADELSRGLDESSGVCPDQGFVRPRVLILCPFRSTAYQCVQQIKAILGENTTVAGAQKLEDEFAPPSDSDDDEDERARNKTKPDDWKALFDNKNVDDDFKFGIQVNPSQGKGSGADKGAYLRLFSDFFISDIIIASPLGLRFIIEAGMKSGDDSQQSNNAVSERSNSHNDASSSAALNKGKKPRLNYDFLSSLETVVLHQADVMYMQNWDHVQFVMQHTNKLPTFNHDTDFSRVRPYFLEGNAAKHRQLLVTSLINTPEIKATFREHAQSVAGICRVIKLWPQEGAISQVLRTVNQVFQKVPLPVGGNGSVLAGLEDAKFSYFKDNILDEILRQKQQRTLIVTPSYLSYVKVRNELIRRETNASFVCEYSRDSEISRGRSKFFHGDNDILLYSGRAHFFRRFAIRGAAHVIFYSLPEYAHFYSEMVNMLNTPPQAEGEATQGAVVSNTLSCVVLFTKYERMALERIVGPERCAYILASAKSTFLFK